MRSRRVDELAQLRSAVERLTAVLEGPCSTPEECRRFSVSTLGLADLIHAWCNRHAVDGQPAEIASGMRICDAVRTSR